MRSARAEEPATPPLDIAALREAPQHADAVAGWLHGQWYRQRGDTLAAVRERLLAEPPGGRYPASLVACRGAEPVGAFTLEATADPLSGLPRLCLADLFVAPDWRRRGVGACLCEAALAQARAWRIPRLSLLTDSHAAYYARLGWAPVQLVAARSGGAEVPALLMSRPTDPIRVSASSYRRARTLCCAPWAPGADP